MKLILASNSPRRKEILTNSGYQFIVMPSSFNEEVFSFNPVETAVGFAFGKASDVFNLLKDNSNVVVLGVDTVVYSDNKILGKSKSDKQAFEMLKRLSGRTHSVISGYALITSGKTVKGYAETQVTFNELTDDVIWEYVKSGLYKGKAGSYGIQDDFPLVKSYNGSLNNFIGLPTEVLYPELNKILNID